MSSIFDAFDNNTITPINLIEDGWKQSRMNKHVFLKWFTITFKNGRTLHCEFFYSFKSEEIVFTGNGIENGMIRYTTKMDSMREFINDQLEQIRKKYEK